MKTHHTRKEDIKRDWHLVDAKGKVLGRLATRIATLLIGKHKVDYSPHSDAGDHIVVINAREVVLTGKKKENKVYFRHSGYPGGFKEVKAAKLLAENPARVIELAVLRMLPENRLKKKRMARLEVFGGDKHPFGKKLAGN